MGRLIYLSNARLPTERAHGLQIVKMCEAFAARDVETLLLHPRRVQSGDLRRVADLWEYYGLARRFNCQELPCLDWGTPESGWLRRHDLLRHLVQTWSYGVVLAMWLSRNLRQSDVLYARVELLSPLLIRLSRRNPVFFELHNWPHPAISRRSLSRLLRSLPGVVTITRGLKEVLLNVGVPEDRLLVSPDGVDLSLFDAASSGGTKAEETTDIPADWPVETQDRPRIVYTGHLYEWKGIRTLFDASLHIPVNHEVIIVGGLPEDVARWKEYCSQAGLNSVRFVGYVRPTQVPAYLQEAEVLVLPSSAKTDISRLYTSPLKLFEYMASGRPIVASRLPSLQEVLVEGHDALMFEPDNPVDLGEKITSLLKDPSAGVTLSQNARRKVEAYSWEARAERILGFIADRVTPDVGPKRSGC